MGYPSEFGNLLYKVYNISVHFECKGQKSKQTYNIPTTDLYALVNHTVSRNVILNVIPADATQSIVGGFQISALMPSAVQAALISAQTIIVNPIKPTSKAVQTAENILSITATCGEKQENQVFSNEVSDPTGSTTPLSFSYTVHCLGPKISDLTPSPLTLSGNVGDPVNGSFSFSNIGDATPDGQRAPLNFTVTGSTGLSVSSTASPLAGGSTATVMVGAKCDVAGTRTYTATVASDDQLKPSAPVSVKVTCVAPLSPKISDPSPSPIQLSGNVGDTLTSSFSFSNATPGTALTFNVSGDTGLTVSSTASPLAGGATATVTVSAKCDTPGTFTHSVTVASDDPDVARQSLAVPVTVTCTDLPPKVGGPTPKPIELGTLRIGQRVTGSASISNVGGGLLQLSAISGNHSPNTAALISISKTSLARGETSTMQMEFTCLSPSYYNATDRWQINDRIAFYTNDITIGSLEFPFHARCIPDDRSVPLVSYSTSAASGKCDYGYYDALDNTDGGSQACFTDIGGAKGWADSRIASALQHYKDQCLIYECDVIETGYGSGPPNGFGESITDYAKLLYR